MKKLKLFLSLIVLIASCTITAQVSINTNGTNPDASAMLDVKSTDKGFLPPRMSTAQRDAINSPAEGLVIYNTSKKRLDIFNGTLWINATGKFSCGDQIMDTDSNTYNTILIGTQCWMAKNLNIGLLVVGTINQTDNDTIEKCCYNNEADSCDVYGGLYRWDEIMQYGSSGDTPDICPTGWHLPTDAEWKTMEMHLGMSQTEADATGWRGTDEGGKLKETGTTHWILPNTGATNTSGFTALPGGMNSGLGFCDGLGNYGYWWSATATGSTFAWIRRLSFDDSEVYRDDLDKGSGYSVRCLKD